MKKSVLPLRTLTAAVFGLALAPNLAAAKFCDQGLQKQGDPVSYDCDYVALDGTTGQFSMTFGNFSSDNGAPNFEMETSAGLPWGGSGQDYSCTCQSKGRVNRPQFGKTRDLLCTNSENPGTAVGRVRGNGKTIRRGSMLNVEISGFNKTVTHIFYDCDVQTP